MTRVNVRYKPAMTAIDLPPGSKMKAFDAFLLSDQLQEPVEAASDDIAALAASIAVKERYETGNYTASIEGGKGELITINGFPRVTGVVQAHGGTYPGARNAETSIAAVVEWGNARAPGARILGRAGDVYHTPKRPE